MLMQSNKSILQHLAFFLLPPYFHWIQWVSNEISKMNSFFTEFSPFQKKSSFMKGGFSTIFVRNLLLHAAAILRLWLSSCKVRLHFVFYGLWSKPFNNGYCVAEKFGTWFDYKMRVPVSFIKPDWVQESSDTTNSCKIETLFSKNPLS